MNARTYHHLKEQFNQLNPDNVLPFYINVKLLSKRGSVNEEHKQLLAKLEDDTLKLLNKIEKEKEEKIKKIEKEKEIQEEKEKMTKESENEEEKDVELMYKEERKIVVQPITILKQNFKLSRKEEKEESEQWINNLRNRKQNNITSIETTVDSSIKQQEHLQSEITNDLISMTGILKQNSMAFGDVLKKDEQTLNEASSKLENNFELIKKNNSLLDKLNNSVFNTTLLSYLFILIVILVYLFTVVFITLF